MWRAAVGLPPSARMVSGEKACSLIICCATACSFRDAPHCIRTGSRTVGGEPDGAPDVWLPTEARIPSMNRGKERRMSEDSPEEHARIAEEAGRKAADEA